MRVIRKNEWKIEEGIDVKQYGFRKGKSSQSVNFILRLFIGQSLEIKKKYTYLVLKFQRHLTK